MWRDFPFSLNVTAVIVGVHIILGLHCASVADTDEVCVCDMYMCN